MCTETNSVVATRIHKTNILLNIEGFLTVEKSKKALGIQLSDDFDKVHHMASNYADFIYRSNPTHLQKDLCEKIQKDLDVNPLFKESVDYYVSWYRDIEKMLDFNERAKETVELSPI